MSAKSRLTIFLVSQSLCFSLLFACSGSSSFHSLSLTGDTSLLLSHFEESYSAGTVLETRTRVIDDSDIKVMLNGLEISKSHYDSDYWGYSFTMPDVDSDMHIQIVSGFEPE